MSPAPLTVICGPMFAGKTTELIRRVRALSSAGHGVLVIKPATDHRYDARALATHPGDRLPATRVERLADALALLDRTARTERPPAAVAIDEIHFFASEAVAPIAALRARGLHVLVAGCDLDHFGDVFAPFDALMPRATDLVRLTGACARCGAPSTHTERLVAATDRIIVGGAAEFAATCAACFRPSRR